MTHQSRHVPCIRRAQVCAAAALVCAALGAAVPGAQSPPPVVIPVDVTVLDRDGKPVDTMTPGSLTVTVDGKPRAIAWIRHVSRGPGALDESTRRQSGQTGALSFAAEPVRNVIVVVDEFSIQRGAERTALLAAGALVDRLGLDDRVGVLRIPVARDSQLALTTERPEVRDALRQIVGKAVTSNAMAADPFGGQPMATTGADPGRATGDPDRATQPDRPPTEAAAEPRLGEDAGIPRTDLLAHLQAVLTSMRDSRVRTTVAVLSAGIPSTTSARIDEIARAAVVAHAMIHVIGLPGGRDDIANPLEMGPLERLAKSTGGLFTTVGRNVDKSLERIVASQSAMYVIGVEHDSSDTSTARRLLRIDPKPATLTVCAPAWLVPRRDVDDVMPAALVEGRGAGDGAVSDRETRPVPARTPTNTSTRAADAAARELEAKRLVTRASAYVGGYQREYSMLVAEETYVQNVRGARQYTRSDLLLVRPPSGTGWVSFRDVYEVDGIPVRDRDDRLKRLFLDPSTQSRAQLASIKAESARYNIGQVERNINVPLFALGFLEFDNLWRFQFKVSGTKEVGGVLSTKVDYEETARPTLVRNDRTQDIEAKGWFLIDPASGAVTSSRLAFVFTDGSSLEFVVTYGRDPNLGLWVPVEMTEVFGRPRYGTIDTTIAVDARATYSKYRRFQVKSETEITIKK